ncbi:hypothetical protein Tco_1538219 [Tanacetum coccineum]
MFSKKEQSQDLNLDLLNTLNGVTKTLKAIQDALKEDHVLNKKVIEATEAYTKNFTHLTELLTLIKNFDFQGLKSSVESLRATALSQDKHLADWANVPQTTLAITGGLANVVGENVTPTVTEEPPSHTKGEIEDTKKEQVPKEPKHVVPISIVKPIETQPITTIITSQSETSQAPKRIDKGKKIATDDVESPVKLVPASKVVQVDPDERVRVPYMINEKMHYLTNDEITKHLEKEELIKKAAEQARLLAITKPEVEGEKFKKAHDAELKVLNKERSEKLRKSLKLKKHMYENYMWTIGNIMKPEKIIDVKIHPHTKPIIPKNKNVVVKDLMKSLSRRYERIKKIPEELGIQSALPAPILSLPEGVPFVNNMVIEEPNNGLNDQDPRERQVLPEAKEVDC